MKKSSILIAILASVLMLAMPQRSEAFFFSFHVGSSGWWHPGYYGWHHPYYGGYYGLPYYAYRYPYWQVPVNTQPVVAAKPAVKLADK